jgi:ubiquinone biosynthesis protein
MKNAPVNSRRQQSAGIHSSAVRRSIADARRMLAVSWIMLRHGMQWLRRPNGCSGYSSVRRLFEDLGVTYVKLGQFLAARFDLIPPELCHELNLLFERVPPVEFSAIRRTIEFELGGALEKFFDQFDQTCIASASIAQVHKARTRDGEWVAVKVQRPGVRAVFDADMRNLRRMAWVCDRFGILHGISAVRFVEEFTAYTAREFDQLIEAETAERIRREMIPAVYVPRVRRDLTTSSVLVLEYVDGVSVADVAAMVEAGRSNELEEQIPGLDLGRVARNLAFATLHQLFVHGFFHADPHPGNILIRRDGRVCLVDFGIFGEITARRRDVLSRYVQSLATGRIEESFKLYRELLTYSSRTDSAAFQRDVKALLCRYSESASERNSAAASRHLGRFGDELMSLLYRHHVTIAMDTLLFWRALIVLDATFLKRAADFDLQACVREFFVERKTTQVARVVFSGTLPSLAGIDWAEAIGEISRLVTRALIPSLAMRKTA